MVMCNLAKKVGSPRSGPHVANYRYNSDIILKLNGDLLYTEYKLNINPLNHLLQNM